MYVLGETPYTPPSTMYVSGEKPLHTSQYNVCIGGEPLMLLSTMM